MGLVASSAPWGWRRQDRKDGGIGRIGLDWRFIYLDITIFSNYFLFLFPFPFSFSVLFVGRGRSTVNLVGPKYGELVLFCCVP